MKEIQKCTPSLHPDAANVNKAIEKIEALSAYKEVTVIYFDLLFFEA
jgi:hypothetical protein